MRLILLSLFTVITLTLSAQYERGNWYLHADSQLGSANSYDPYSFTDGASLGVGKFVADRFLVGAVAQSNSYSGQSASLLPYLRYYLPNGDRKLAFFAEAGAQLGLAYDDRFNLAVHAGIGAEYQLAPGVLLTGLLSYNTGNSRLGATTNLKIGLNTVIGFGLRPEGGYQYDNRKGSFLLDAQIANLTYGNWASNRWYIDGEAQLDLGYYLTENILLEGSLSFGSGRTSFTTDLLGREFYSLDYSASIGGRYLFRAGKRFQPYAGVGLHFRYRDWRNVDTELAAPGSRQEVNISENFLTGYVQGGFLYHLTDRLSVDLNLRMNGGGNASFFSAGVGLKVRLGKGN